MNIIKYIFLISVFFISKVPAQVSNTELNNILVQSFTNLSSVSFISYDLAITTLEANKITNTSKATVNEVWQPNSYYVLYKINPNQLLFIYNNSSGIERFWFGRNNDLPEVKLKDLDSKFLSTAISYSNFIINPLWLSIPVASKMDQGFYVIQSYNKNKYSIFSKMEYYINKDKIPVRILYYNNISNFPVAEVLITDYKKLNQAYIIHKIEYKDNITKKITILEKSNVIVNNEPPLWLENIKSLINNNLNAYSNYFMMAIRNESEVIKLTQKEKIRSEIVKESDTLNLNAQKDTSKQGENYKELNNKQSFPNSIDLLRENSLNNENDNLLKALNNTKENNEENTPKALIPLIPNVESSKKAPNKPVSNKAVPNKSKSASSIPNKVQNRSTSNLKPNKPVKKAKPQESNKTLTTNENLEANKLKENPSVPLNKEFSPSLPKEESHQPKTEILPQKEAIPNLPQVESDPKKPNKKKNSLNSLF